MGRTVEHLSFESVLNKAPLANATMPTQIFLARSEGDLDKIKARISEIERDSLGKIDFSRQLLLCVVAGNRPSTGHAIHVQNVLRSGNQILISIYEEKPGFRQVVEDAETIPFEIILLETATIAPEGHGQVLFRLVDEQGNELARAIYSP